MIERFFRLRERGTTARTEVLGGATTFVAMVYIVVVNPAILAFAGIPTGPSTVATILIAALGTLAMGLFANRPIAVAPYMGENAFIAFGLAAMGIGWQQRLGAVFVAGLLFLALTLLGLRSAVARAVSPSLRASFAVGIGLFLALIGLYEAGIVRSFVAGMPAAALLGADGTTLRNPDVPLSIGAVTSTPVLLALGGLFLTLVLLARQVRGAILLGIAATATAGALLGLGRMPRGIVALPFAGEYSLGPIAGQLDIVGVLQPAFLPVLLTLFLMGFLDTLGTLLGLDAAMGGRATGSAAPAPQAPGEDPLLRPMIVDAAACMASGLVGTSTSGAYIESAAGIREGARTGLASVVTGLLFGLCLFFLPLVEPLQQMRFAYAPALVAVGLLMVGAARDIDFTDLVEAVPAVLTVLFMVFTYNIANGLTAGLIAAPLLKLCTGRWRQVDVGSAVLGLLCVAYYAFGLPH